MFKFGSTKIRIIHHGAKICTGCLASYKSRSENFIFLVQDDLSFGEEGRQKKGDMKPQESMMRLHATPIGGTSCSMRFTTSCLMIFVRYTKKY